MKRIIVLLLCLIAFFVPKQLLAQQDITGLWKGQIYDDTAQLYIPYEIVISVDNGKLSGYSYATTKDSTGKDEIGLKSIKIKQKPNNQVEIEDADLMVSTYSVAPSRGARKQLELTLVVKDSVMEMSGKWSTTWIKEHRHIRTGTVTLQRKNDLWRDEPLIKKLDTMKIAPTLSFVKAERRPEYADNYVAPKQPVVKAPTPKKVAAPAAVKPAVVKAPVVIVPAAAEVAERKTTTIQSIYFQSDSLMLTLYDNGTVDGDTVSIMSGDKLIFSKQGLSDKPVTKAFYTKDITDSSTLILYAENLGSIPPNTGLVIIYDGTKRYEVFFSADLKTNAAIMLRRKKDVISQ